MGISLEPNDNNKAFMLISTKLKWAFVHNPKTGGTSIKQALLPHFDPDQYKFEDGWVTDGKGIRPHVVKIPEGFQSFGVVRNPWDRLCSTWRFRASRGMLFCSFSEFLKNLPPESRKPQSHWLEGVDHVLRFEEMPGVFEVFAKEKLGLDVTMPHLKRTAAAPVWAGAYTREDVRNALPRIVEDLESYDYKEHPTTYYA